MKQLITQVFEGQGVRVEFKDKKQNHHSSKSHPRDIIIVQVTRDKKVLKLRDRDLAKLREAIAVDIRLGEGASEVGVAKGLLHK